MAASLLSLNLEVNAALMGFAIGLAIVIVITALIFAAITLTKAEKANKPIKQVTSIAPENPPADKSGAVSSPVVAPAIEPITPSEPASVAAEPAATFSVSDLEVTPLEAKEGETVTVSFRVTNTSHVSGDYHAELRVNGKVVNTEVISLAPGTSKVATFNVVENDAGEHKVEVGELEGKFFIPEANIRVTSLSVNPGQVREGEKVNVAAEVVNTGGVTGSDKLELKLNGKVASVEEITLAPGETKSATFAVAGTGAGEHKVEVGGLKGKFFISEANIYVAALSANPRRVKEGGKVNVVAEVVNTGGAAGSYQLELKLNGVVVAMEKVTVGPGVNQKVNFTLNLQPGSYKVEIGKFSDRFVVEMAKYL